VLSICETAGYKIIAMTLRRYIRYAFICTALLALSLRSLIPVGYMPDFSGHGKGLFPIVICDGVDHAAQDSPCPMHHSPGGHTHLCPFGASAIFSFDTKAIDIDAHFAYRPSPYIPFSSQSLGKQPAFNNASPRSPPFFS
jgi:hypothetical protein